MGTRQIARYGLLTSMMLVLGLVERQFVLAPGIPGIRLGLSNTVLLYALCLMGARSAWLLMGLKVLLSGLLFAGVSGMFYSFAGGVLSMIAMILILRVPGPSMVGVSVCGAAFHMIGQVLMSRAVLGSWAAAAQTPLLLVAATATGVLTGIIAQAACRAIARSDPDLQKRLSESGLMWRGKP